MNETVFFINDFVMEFKKIMRRGDYTRYNIIYMYINIDICVFFF